MHAKVVLRLTQLTILWSCAWLASSSAEYIQLLEFDDDGCQTSQVAFTSATETGVCVHHASGKSQMFFYNYGAKQPIFYYHANNNCTDPVSEEPSMLALPTNCSANYGVIAVGVSDLPAPNHELLASFGGGTYCMVERTIDCDPNTASYQYILEGACIRNTFSGEPFIVACTESAMTIDAFQYNSYSICEAKNGLNNTIQSNGICVPHPWQFRLGATTTHVAFLEKVTVKPAVPNFTPSPPPQVTTPATDSVSLGEAIGGTISAVASVAIAGSAAGAASASVVGSVGGSGGGAGGGGGHGGSGNLTSTWLLVFQIQFLSLISSMGSAAMKAFGSSLSWANMFAAIQGIGTQCDDNDDEGDATGGILVFFMLLVPLVILHVVVLASLHAYIRVKAPKVEFKTPATLQFPRIELRVLLVALAGQTYAYSRLAACGKDAGISVAGVVLLLLFPVPFLALIFHIVTKLRLSDEFALYELDDAMKFDSVKTSVVPVGKRMWENIRQLQSLETDICRGDWASVLEDGRLKDDFLGRYGLIFEDYTHTGAKYAFVMALCTAATSFFLAVTSSKTASVLVLILHVTQYFALVLWSPFNNAVINAQEIAGGFFNLVTLVLVLAGVYLDSDDFFENAMHLQIFVILIKGFPGIIGAAQGVVQLCLFGYQCWSSRRAADEEPDTAAQDQSKSKQLEVSDPHSDGDSAPESEPPAGAATQDPGSGAKSAPVSRSSSAERLEVDEEEIPGDAEPEPEPEPPVPVDTASQGSGTKSAPVSRSSSMEIGEEKVEDPESQADAQQAQNGEGGCESTAEVIMSFATKDMGETDAAVVESLFELYQLSREIGQSAAAEGGSTRLNAEERQQFKKEFFDLTKQFATRAFAETNSAIRESVRRPTQMRSAVGRVSLQLRAAAAARSSIPAPSPSQEATPGSDVASEVGTPPANDVADVEDVEDVELDVAEDSLQVISLASPQQV